MSTFLITVPMKFQKPHEFIYIEKQYITDLGIVRFFKSEMDESLLIMKVIDLDKELIKDNLEEIFTKVAFMGFTKVRIDEDVFNLNIFWVDLELGMPRYICGNIAYVNKTEYTHIYKEGSFNGVKTYKDLSVEVLKESLAQYKRLQISPAIPNDLYVLNGSHMTPLKEIVDKGDYQNTLLLI